MLSLSAYSCREAFLINYIIKKLEKCKKWPENGLEKCIKLAVLLSKSLENSKKSRTFANKKAKLRI